MVKCEKCGAEIANKFCEECGAPAPAADPLQKNVTPDTVSVSTDKKKHTIPDKFAHDCDNNYTTTTAGWLGWLALAVLVPIIGFVIIRYVSKDESVKNFATAGFIISIVLIFVFIFCYLTAGIIDIIGSTFHPE